MSHGHRRFPAEMYLYLVGLNFWTFHKKVKDSFDLLKVVGQKWKNMPQMVGLMVMYHSGIIRKQKKQTKANKCQYLGIQIFLPQKFASAKMAGESLITVVGFENRQV